MQYVTGGPAQHTRYYPRLFMHSLFEVSGSQAQPSRGLWDQGPSKERLATYRIYATEYPPRHAPSSRHDTGQVQHVPAKAKDVHGLSFQVSGFWFRAPQNGPGLLDNLQCTQASVRENPYSSRLHVALQYIPEPSRGYIYIYAIS